MIPLRILLIEDDGLIGLMLGELLQELGHAICGIATTEADAVAAAARCRPDLMIVHARLAAGSGISAVATILRNGHVAHLFTSGGSTNAYAPGAVVLRKPFRETELVRAMDRAVAVKAA